jgi:DNA polymerase-3 subunit alpha
MNRTEGVEVTIGGMINRVKKSVTKNGKSAGMPMAMITLEDLEGQIDGVVWAEKLAELQNRGDLVSVERIVFVKGKIDRRRETPSIVVNEIVPIEDAVTRMTTGVVVKLDRERHRPETVVELKPVLSQYRGNVPVFMQVPVNGSQTASIRLTSDSFIKPSNEMVQDLERVLEAGRCSYAA